MKTLFTLSLLLSLEICLGQNKSNNKVFEILCDSIYKGKDYKITLLYFPDGIGSKSNFNTVFQFLRTVDSKQKILFQDTLYSRTGEIKFKDFNNDNVKDILIHNISDVRSNWTYYLFKVNLSDNSLKKVKGFEEIKNPKYLPQYDLIDNYVNSGKNWTSFYKIVNDNVKDFGIVIYDDPNEDNKSTYEQEYKKSITKILEKTSR